MNGIALTLLSFYGWLLLVRFLTMRGLGPFSSFTRDMSKFMLGKALGPANELFQNRARLCRAHLAAARGDVVHHRKHADVHHTVEGA